jgi:hypothetical protein
VAYRIARRRWSCQFLDDYRAELARSMTFGYPRGFVVINDDSKVYCDALAWN